MGSLSTRRNGLGHAVAVLALVLLLAISSVAQAAHFHKEKSDSHHACTVCAAHAPALVAVATTILPRACSAGQVHAAEVSDPLLLLARTFFIRPPPSA